MLYFLIPTFFLFFAFAQAAPLKCSVSAESAVVMNAETGAILFEKGAHLRLFPASLTKIATALYVLERKRDGLYELATASEDSVGVVAPHLKQGAKPRYLPHQLEPGGTHMGIKVGEKLPLSALIYGLMLVSGNDAANVLATHTSQSVPRFMEEVNGYLKSIGCLETHFNNPHGLHHSEHYTTAFDLALMTKKALSIPFFREVVKTTRYDRPETNKQPSSSLVQFNRLLKPGKFFYPKAIGVKTGHTSRAGHNLSAAAKQGDRTLIAILLNSPTPEERFQDAIKLFETAFQEQKVSRVLFAKDFDLYSNPVKGGKTILRAGLSEDLKIDYYPSEEPELKAFLSWDSMKLPIAQGDRVGEIRLMTKEGRVLKAEPLFAMEDVERTLWVAFLDGVSSARTARATKWAAALLLISGIAYAIYCWSRRKKATHSSKESS